jgi:hypothetical protein
MRLLRKVPGLGDLLNRSELHYRTNETILKLERSYPSLFETGGYEYLGLFSDLLV